MMLKNVCRLLPISRKTEGLQLLVQEALKNSFNLIFSHPLQGKNSFQIHFFPFIF